MNISVERKKAEAIARMELLGILPDTIRQFEKEDLISRSDPPFGVFYWVEGEDLKHLREFENKNNALVYMVVRSYHEIGKMDSYLFVSDYEEEWKQDREDLQDGQSLAYVNNLDDEWCSEFGSIGIKKSVAAGLLRTW